MGSLTHSMYDLRSEIEEVAVNKFVENPKVSIIIPTYNNEQFIKKCLFSLCKQTLKEIEIIIIDDGSTDSSRSIIQTFASIDKRFVVIHQDHAKQGAARNKGIKAARGEYIGFVDSDDWVDLDYYEKLYNTAKKYDSDIALATNIRIGNGKTKKRLNIIEEIFTTTLQEKIDISTQAKNPCPTNKIYRTTLLKNNEIYYPEGVYCEDKLFTIQAIYYANGVVTVPNVNYYYFRNPNSTVNSKKIKHTKILNNDKNNAKLAVLNFLKEKKADIRDCEFWATTKEIRFCGIPVYSEKESLATRKGYIFSYIKIFQKRIEVNNV